MSKIIDKIAWIYICNGQVLGARSHGKGLYYLPGGKREPGESDEETLIREIKEELSVHILPESISYVGTFAAQADGKPEGITVKMSCYSAEFSGELQPDSEIAELVWLTYQDRDRVSRVSQIIFDQLHQENRLM
ncbi:NUDIX domain-containing protein [Paenibacillus sp. P96]|uniref:NUDIX domain-containing protein n=1 Tax=Paenibacillus zeirhizosphaerae TaxID=2987519 RepID=A0ABT9FR43_9BACL|nr:NUDIX domain-containing protein [Paenibacillus sp. P96]MDP4097204.1 NUDIX domain-containing protein [Paenibacillus sp. P96]